MIISKSSGLALLCAAVASAAFAQQSMDLREAIRIATENNPRIKVLTANRAVAEADIRTAQQINNFSLIGETTRSQPNYFAGGGYILELGGKRGKRTDVARSAAKVSEIEYRLGLLSLRHDVRIAYFKVLQSRGRKQELGVTRDLAQRLVDIAQQRFEAGDVARLEVLTAQLELKQRENDFLQAETDEKAALLEFTSLLSAGMPENVELLGSIEDIAEAPALNTLLQQAQNQHLELQSLQEQIRGEQANLALARALRIPDVETEAGTEIHDAEFQYGWRFSLRFDVPLLNRHEGEILHSNAALQGLLAQQSVLLQRINTDVSAAYLKYQSALYQAENFRKDILPSSRELEELAEESYKEGRTGVLGVMEAQRSARQVKSEYYDVLLQYQTAVADLEQASGVELP